ncbi:MAG: FAD binding domain-containing protein, partial [Acidobacteria bacterium]|nr:FAD binding domain-containing protein [Acidobacteriota bacterium]
DTRCNYYDQTYEWRKSIDFCMKKDGDICWVAPGSPRCWAVSSTDLAPVMLALGAQIHLVSGRSDRMLDANDFYQHDGIDYLNKRHDEIVTDVRLPAVHGDLMIFKKLRRRGSIDFPILNVAVWIRPDSNRRVCEDVRIAIGAVTSRPLLAEEARQALLGKPLVPETIEAAAQKAYRVCKPMDNTDLHFSWRHKMVSVWVSRALEELQASF